MEYLVLGSAGQIGKPLCEYLKKIGHKVIEFDLVDGEYYDLRKSNALNDVFLNNNIDFVVFFGI